MSGPDWDIEQTILDVEADRREREWRRWEDEHNVFTIDEAETIAAFIGCDRMVVLGVGHLAWLKAQGVYGAEVTDAK